LSPEQAAICPTFPRLFPRQIDENSVGGAGGGCRTRSTSIDD
jgi:hypothetical protein